MVSELMFKSDLLLFFIGDFPSNEQQQYAFIPLLQSLCSSHWTELLF